MDRRNMLGTVGASAVGRVTLEGIAGAQQPHEHGKALDDCRELCGKMAQIASRNAAKAARIGSR